MTYLCEACGFVFANPHPEELCPVCGADCIVPVDQCPRCDSKKPVEQRLCNDCMKHLVTRFCDFADTLTQEEEDALDDLLDGESIQNRTHWRKRYAPCI